MRPIEKRLDKLSSELCKLTYFGKCHICGETGTDTHHIISRNHKRQRWNIHNLVYLCRGCHGKAHDYNLTFDRVIDRTVKIWHESELRDLETQLKQKMMELGL